jgi:hypothetical protein
MRQLNAIGTEFFSPSQVFFATTNAGGRSLFPVDGTPQAMNTAYQVRTTPDGTVDLIRLETGDIGWGDLGGKGAYDVRAGRV